ncbi:hypothetical protein J437_LFUL017319 [Ladona fulva]|uniref:Uncharacterized protein n=1 Tax=Ladona fulva TaxID=123851 RepID=A0A8K0KLS0_LADFU|nr:hypothetical protein J437_LFUL017319 [Ladona fulva]
MSHMSKGPSATYPHSRSRKVSAITEHIWSRSCHTIDLDNTKVLSKEAYFFPRIIHEAVEIVKRPINFNREDGYPP